MHEHVSLFALVAVVKLVGVDERAREVDEVLPVAVAVGSAGVLFQDERHAFLVGGAAEVDFGLEERVAEGFGEHGYCPGMDVEEDDAGVEAVLVLCCDEVDVG